MTLRLQIEPTAHVVEVDTGGAATVPMRAWQGVTPEGVNVILFVYRVAVPLDAPAGVQAQFDAALIDVEMLVPGKSR